MGKISIICIVLLGMVHGLAALSCIVCSERECEKPRGCKKGTALDVCGCCEVCVKLEGETCGGLWGLDGTCAKGLTCVIEEPDETDPFIYPFDAGICQKVKKEKKEKKKEKEE
ncbi:venom protein 302-like [Branchiostoma floridae x Branchiostoma japonicum]